MTPSSHAPDLPTFIEDHQLPALLDQLREAHKNLKVAKRNFLAQRKASLKQEIQAAWVIRDFKQVHFLSRLLSGNAIGIKCRIWATLRFIPDSSQLPDLIVAPALQGGLEATIVSKSEQFEAWTDPANGFLVDPPSPH